MTDDELTPTNSQCVALECLLSGDRTANDIADRMVALGVWRSPRGTPSNMSFAGASLLRSLLRRGWVAEGLLRHGARLWSITLAGERAIRRSLTKRDA